MTPLESVLTWKWTPTSGYRSTYSGEEVNALFRMFRRFYPRKVRQICITDDASGIAPGVEVIPDFGDFANVPSPHGGKNPSCYRRLRMYHPDAAKWFGRRFFSLDLDSLICGDLSSLLDRPEDLVLWGDQTNPKPGSYYNGSFQLVTAGCRPQVWNDFNPETSPDEARYKGNAWGSDQGWISYKLKDTEAKWTKADGVYSYRNDIEKKGNRLPPDARLVSWHGRLDPWHPEAQQLDWVRAHYNLPVEAHHA